MDIKKIIKYIVLIFIVVSVGMFIFYYYFTKPIPGIDNTVTEPKKLTIFGINIGGGSTNNTGSEGNTPTENQTSQGSTTPTDLLKLRQLSQSPVAGFISFENEKKENIVRYMEKSNGNIYEIGTKSATQKRITNTTIPRVYEALWLKPTSIMVRYLDDNNIIKTFNAEIKDLEKGATEQKIEGFFLQDNIEEITSVEEKIFYLISNSSGSQGILSKPNGDNKSIIFESPLKEWLISYPQKNTMTFNTKPSFAYQGSAYFFDLNKQTTTKFIQNIFGITTLNNGDKTGLLFSESINNSFSLNYFDLNKKTRSEIFPKTLPEKCIWAKDNKVVFCGIPKDIPKGGYPDIWYQGIVSFYDDIWKIDIENNIAKRLISPKDFVNQEIDLTKPILSGDEKYLFFVNKKDSMLWSLEL